MKKILLVFIPFCFITILTATHLTPIDYKGDLDISYGGNFVTRAIMNNNLNERDGGWMDNRLRFDLAAKIGDRFVLAWKPEVGYQLFSGFGKDGGFMTRELYCDYMFDIFETNLRIGRHYWADHRGLILDDYLAGLTADMKIAGLDAELGFIKANEGLRDKLDDQHEVFFNIIGQAPIKWNVLAMFGQNHQSKTADVWIEPTLGLEFAPLNLDITAVINNQMFKDANGDDDSELGIGLAVKAGADLGIKIGTDILFVTQEGINTLSPYYENGLYIFGNKLAFDGTQLTPLAPYTGNGNDAYMSIVFNGALPINEDMEFFAALGMAKLKDPFGSEINFGVNYNLFENCKATGVIAVGNSGKEIDPDENLVYMAGGLISVDF